ncbi:MAG: Uma2 family endonuclease [Oscillatoriaceae cyanobacterium Prado104]|jgi:Uma2 family endonuclease|nr:Uma2 family endonuclease [Oscillatoriaceae cyanobacterium Prado104]
MTIATQISPEEIQYPSSDGEPMAESDITRDYMTYGVEAVGAFFQNRGDVYVSANSFIYYEADNPEAVVAPDLYVVFGVPKRKRDIYQVWKEGGITPDFVMEITSETTQAKDQKTKPETYQKLGVREYFQYDPSGDYLNPILQGLRLVNGEYEPIPANNIAFDTLWLYSEVLELELHLISGELRFKDPQTGEFLKTYQESEQARFAEQQARLAAEQARLAAEQARVAEQQARLAAEQARLTAESTLSRTATQLFNSGMSLEQISQIMDKSIEEVQRLVGGN